MGYLYILATITFTVYGQLITKWRVNGAGAFPPDILPKVVALLSLVMDPWIISSLFAAFLAFLFWVLALSKFDLSFSYPFMSLSFVLVLFMSFIFFREPLTLFKILGIAFIVLGIIIGAKG